MSALSEYRRRLSEWSDIQDHLQFLHDTVIGYDRPVVVELGVGWGNSTSALLTAVTERDGQLWSVDAGELRETNMIPEDWWENPRWKFLKADDLSASARAAMPDECDVLFIDSDHSYQHVIDVLDVYMPRLRPGGVALLHDTQFEYPDIDLGEPVGEVAMGLTNWCELNNLTWENRPGSYGMGIVRP